MQACKVKRSLKIKIKSRKKMKIVMKIVMLLAWAGDGAHGKVFSQRLSSYKKLRHREAGLEKVRSFICLKMHCFYHASLRVSNIHLTYDFKNACRLQEHQNEFCS